MLASEELRLGWFAWPTDRPDDPYGVVPIFEQPFVFRSMTPRVFTWLPSIYDWFGPGRVRIWRATVRIDLRAWLGIPAEHDLMITGGRLLMFAEDEVTLEGQGRWWVEDGELLRWTDKLGRTLASRQEAVGWKSVQS